MIHLKEVSKTYRSDKGNRPVLKGVSLSVEEGEFVSIIGYSGSGKTTLVKIASGLLNPDSGNVTIAGQPVTQFPTKAAVVFQNYSLLPWFSALENVRLAVEAAFPTRSRKEQQKQAAIYLEMVGLGNAMDKRPSQLSGGMRQRVAIARAFAVEPRILFLDEPFGALDALTRATLQQELARLCFSAGRPVSAIMVTNSVEEAILLSDRIVPMSRGPNATLGPGVEVNLARPRSTASLGRDKQALRIHAHIVEYLTGFAQSATITCPRQAVASPAIPDSRTAEAEAQV